MQASNSSDQYGFIRVAAVVPELKVGNISHNAAEIISAANKASAKGASFIVFPELSLTGYSIGDLFHQELIWKRVLSSLADIKTTLKNNPALILIGTPLLIDGKQFNTAVALYKGDILGVIPKTYLPGYKEFYEKRWFSPADDLTITEFPLLGRSVPVGTDLLIRTDDGQVTFAAEICEDLWGPLPPSSYHAVAGANIIANLSASNELVGKSLYRRSLVANQSARTIAGYVYSSCGMNESSTDLAFSGHALIAENGYILRETEVFENGTQILLADIDVDQCQTDRIRTTSFADSQKKIIRPYRVLNIKGFPKKTLDSLMRPIARNPFLPADGADRYRVAKEVFSIQAAGLTTRLKHSGIKHAVIGLSGGLDSTLALLVAIKAFKNLNLPLKNIHAFTMPGFGTTKTTKSNAYLLAQGTGISIEEIDITGAVREHFKDIKHDEKIENTTFENSQARYRTMILMNKANQLNALVVGTGDLSEIALGWATFNGDHISHYNVNASVPKTLVRHVVAWVKDTSNDKKLSQTIENILGTPVSPELKRPKKGKIVQKTESIIGPYELHDFFLYHFIRWGSRPSKILFLASQAYKDTYPKAEIKKWLLVFIKRFFGNQWKRSVMSDGPKVGSVALSPRGDWRMPSDADVSSWLEELS